MDAYIRKVFPHDEDHEVSITTDIFSRFFANQHTMHFVNANGMVGIVTVNNATDLRFGGDFKRLCGEIYENDFIVIVKRRNDYQLSVIRQDDDGYDFCNTFYTGLDRHAIITSDDVPPQGETNTLDEANLENNLELEIDENVDFSQIIYYGAPGTGKSNKIENDLFNDANGNRHGLNSVEKGRKFRTTFHPDYDYAQFVGAYKPKAIPANSQNEGGPDDDDLDRPNQRRTEITYEFTPQVFANAYIKAWKEFLNATEKKVYLVIEEINRGNCAQIFGDIFQLLDRKDGHSAYSIDVDIDFADHIKKQLAQIEAFDENGTATNCWCQYQKKIREWDQDNNGRQAAAAENNEKFCKAALPPNLIILATMNTSDQSLFPMDSAFKRRFDWEYVPIDDSHLNARFNIVIDDNYSCPWLTFLKKVNDNILAVTHSEDKQMGEFFIKPKDGSNNIKFEEFRSKVLFYLWDSVYKDELDNEDALVFRLTNGNDVEKITFQKLFEGGSAQLERQKTLVKRIIDSIVPAAARAGAAREILAEAGVENHEGQA